MINNKQNKETPGLVFMLFLILIGFKRLALSFQKIGCGGLWQFPSLFTLSIISQQSIKRQHKERIKND